MKVENLKFLTALKDKSMRTLLVVNRMEGDLRKVAMTAVLEVKIPYTEKTEMVWVDAETDMRIENYSSYGNGSEKRATGTICFHLSRWEGNHIETFLKDIKKDSDVRFKVVAFNGNETWKEVGLVSHSLYGEIGNKCYLLDTFVGKDNTASPVR